MGQAAEALMSLCSLPESPASGVTGGLRMSPWALGHFRGPERGAGGEEMLWASQLWSRSQSLGGPQHQLFKLRGAYLLTALNTPPRV